VTVDKDVAIAKSPRVFLSMESPSDLEFKSNQIKFLGALL